MEVKSYIKNTNDFLKKLRDFPDLLEESVICTRLKIFLDRLNNFHISIKFTCEYSREKVNYLDVQVIVTKGKLMNDLLICSAN